MSIPEAEQRKLFARSGNRCAFPDCRRVLTAEGSPPDRSVVLGEMAHIVAERPQGPRGNSSMTTSDRKMPRRVVVHKTSRNWPAEREGLTSVLPGGVARYDLVALSPQSAVRLITPSKYPPLRCTRFSVGELDYLYTTGFIASLNEFHAMHVPSPIQMADHVGQDTSRQTLFWEVLALTKMNWNSAQFGGLLPITLQFSCLVGDIMREIPLDRHPLPQFKYYM